MNAREQTTKARWLANRVLEVQSVNPNADKEDTNVEEPEELRCKYFEQRVLSKRNDT